MHRKINDAPSLDFFTPEQLEKAEQVLHDHQGDDILMERRQENGTLHRTIIETPNGRQFSCMENGRETGDRQLQLLIVRDDGEPLPMLEGQTVIFRSPEETYAAYVVRQAPSHRADDPSGAMLIDLRVL